MCMEKYYHQIQFITFFSDPLILYNLKKKKRLDLVSKNVCYPK